jgi:D-amino-acid dehydrogenase
MKVAVIGGGVIGLFAAHYCAQRGWDVTVIERNGEARDGCSYQNTGMVVPSHFVPLAAPGMVGLALKWMLNPASPFYVKPRPSWELMDWGLKFWQASNADQVRRAAPVLRDLALASRDLYRKEGFALEPRGLLALCKTEHALEEEAHVAGLARELGLSAEVLDAKQTAAREPGVRMDVAGSVHYPQDGNLAPDKLMATLQQRSGARFKWNTDVTGFRRENSMIRAVETACGETLEADQFLLCAGSWSPKLAAQLGLSLPMQAGKGYSVTLPKPKQAPKQCAILSEARVAVSPIDGALRFGGTMELAGLNEDINPVRVQGIVDAARRYYPELTEADFAGIKPWRGLRPCSPDGLPYIGRTLENLTVATGHAMLGITLGPITGKLCSEIIAGEKPGMDLTLLSPERFN